MQRKLPSPGFQVEVVLVDYDPAAAPPRPPSETSENSGANPASRPTPGPVEDAAATAAKDSKKDKDDEFSDSDSEETASSKSRQTGASSQAAGSVATKDATAQKNVDPNEIANLTRKTDQVALGSSAAEAGNETVGGAKMSSSAGEVSEFKAMAADASIFSFGDDDDEESD